MIRCLHGGELIARRPCPIHDHKYKGAWRSTTATVLARDNHRCVMCGRPCPHADPTADKTGHHHVDHISHDIPNRDALSNLRTVCLKWNVTYGKGCK